MSDVSITHSGFAGIDAMSVGELAILPAATLASLKVQVELIYEEAHRLDDKLDAALDYRYGPRAHQARAAQIVNLRAVGKDCLGFAERAERLKHPFLLEQPVRLHQLLAEFLAAFFGQVEKRLLVGWQIGRGRVPAGRQLRGDEGDDATSAAGAASGGNGSGRQPTAAQLQDALARHYAGSQWVTVEPVGDSTSIDPLALNDTNKMELRVFGNEEFRHAVLIARLDNLGKGASGAAVQNLELMLGL